MQKKKEEKKKEKKQTDAHTHKEASCTGGASRQFPFFGGRRPLLSREKRNPRFGSRFAIGEREEKKAAKDAAAPSCSKERPRGGRVRGLDPFSRIKNPPEPAGTRARAKERPPAFFSFLFSLSWRKGEGSCFCARCRQMERKRVAHCARGSNPDCTAGVRSKRW